MTGKEKCKLLRQIRKEIAETNGIEYVVTECTYEGEDCRGTCPKCDSEIAYLDAELNKKIIEGELVTLAGLSLETFNFGMDTNQNANDEIDDDFDVIEGDLCEGQLNEMTIEELELSVRSFNCLKRAGINTVTDLTEKTIEDMMRVRNLGRKGVEEVEAKLNALGLSFSESTSADDDDLFSVTMGEIPVMGGLREGPADSDACLGLSIEELDLSVRAYNCLKRHGIETVEDIIAMSEDDLMKVRNLGRRSMEEVIQKINSMGLSIKPCEENEISSSPIAHPESATCQGAGRITTCVISKISCTRKGDSSVEVNFIAQKTANREGYSPSASIEARYRVKDADGIIILNEYWKYNGIVVGDVVRGTITVDNVKPGYSIDFVDF